MKNYRPITVLTQSGDSLVEVKNIYIDKDNCIMATKESNGYEYEITLGSYPTKDFARGVLGDLFESYLIGQVAFEMPECIN